MCDKIAPRAFTKTMIDAASASVAHLLLSKIQGLNSSALCGQLISYLPFPCWRHPACFNDVSWHYTSATKAVHGVQFPIARLFSSCDCWRFIESPSNVAIQLTLTCPGDL